MGSTGNNPKSTLVFAWIGKATAVLTLFYLIVQIFSLFSGGKYSLSAQGDYNRVELFEYGTELIKDGFEPQLELGYGFNLRGVTKIILVFFLTY